MIHKYTMDGEYIVLDVNSGSVHAVDALVFDMLDHMPACSLEQVTDKLKDKYNPADIKDAYSEILMLKENELLFFEEEYDGALAKRIDQTVDRNPVVKALCLHIAHDCNLKCKYCFAEEGEYHGKRALMSLEVGKKAIDLLIQNSGNRHNLEIDFFGGEPLLNFETVKGIVSYAQSLEAKHNKTFRFTITTNGVLLHEDVRHYINAHMNNVVLSIDGRKEVNDNMRKKAGGQGTYDDIVPKFQKIAEERNQTNYYVRGTFTRENLDFSEDVLHLYDLGFKQVSVEPVVSSESEPHALREEDLPTLFSEYEKLALRLLELKKEGKEFNFFHFSIDLTGGPCIYKRIVGCGAGTEYLAVTPEGDLYPCHQFVGMEDFKIGTVFDGVTDTALRDTFENCTVYAKEQCRDCFAKFYCSGGCAANAYNMNGDIHVPYEIGCELQRKRTECAIFMKVAASHDEVL